MFCYQNRSFILWMLIFRSFKAYAIKIWIQDTPNLYSSKYWTSLLNHSSTGHLIIVLFYECDPLLKDFYWGFFIRGMFIFIPQINFSIFFLTLKYYLFTNLLATLLLMSITREKMGLCLYMSPNSHIKSILNIMSQFKFEWTISFYSELIILSLAGIWTQDLPGRKLICIF